MSTPLPVIGICGDLGVGKDTLAAEIIQCQLSKSETYTIRKFASKLRVAVSIITGIPADKTVSEADKQVDLSGLRWPLLEFDDRLARAVRAVVGTAKDIDVSKWTMKFIPILAVRAAASGPLTEVQLHPGTTVGRLLQLLGTECFRDTVGSGVWVNALFDSWSGEGRPPIIVADTRFPNESAAVRQRGGVVIRVARRGQNRNDGRSTRHASERALDDEKPDIVIDNNGTIADLRASFLAAWPDLLAIAATRVAEPEPTPLPL